MSGALHDKVAGLVLQKHWGIEPSKKGTLDPSADIVKMIDWKPVSRSMPLDQLPVLNQDVLVRYQDGVVDIAQLVASEKDEWGEEKDYESDVLRWAGSANESMYLENVTHWQYIPKRPL